MKRILAVGVACLLVPLSAAAQQEIEGAEALRLAVAPFEAAGPASRSAPEIAEALHKELRAAGVPSFFDTSGAIGRRYRRQDEAGTPWCVTVDGQSVEDQNVTVRDRDTMEQTRIGVDTVRSWVQQRLGGSD